MSCRPRVILWPMLAVVLACRSGAAPGPRSPAPPPFAVVPIGLCEDYPEESRSMDEVRRDIDLMKQAGVGVLRVSLGWDGIEPAAGRYELAFWDSFFAAMAAAHIRVIPYVAYTPRWASSGSGDDYWRYPPADDRTFAALVGMLARRYRGQVTSWELWNEPDNRDFWRGTAAQFAELLAAGAAAVRAADPGAQVVFGGVAGHPDFATEVLARPQLAALVDVVNAHAYFETWNPDPIESLPRYVAAFDPVLAGSARSLWLAEIGYSNYRQDGAVSADVQARSPFEHTLPFQAVALVRMVTLALSRPEVSLVAWYELKDPRPGAPVIGDDNNRHLGVAFSDWRPKPALAALALVQRLFGTGFRRLDGVARVQRPAGSRAEVHAFLTAGGVAIVAWNPDGATLDRVSVSLPGWTAAGPPRWLDAEGRPRTPPISSGSPAGLALDGIELRGGEVVVAQIPVNGPPLPHLAAGRAHANFVANRSAEGAPCDGSDRGGRCCGGLRW